MLSACAATAANHALSRLLHGWMGYPGVPLLGLAPCEGGRHYRTTGLPSSGNEDGDEMKRMAPASRDQSSGV